MSTLRNIAIGTAAAAVIGTAAAVFSLDHMAEKRVRELLEKHKVADMVSFKDADASITGRTITLNDVTIIPRNDEDPVKIASVVLQDFFQAEDGTLERIDLSLNDIFIDAHDAAKLDPSVRGIIELGYDTVLMDLHTRIDFDRRTGSLKADGRVRLDEMISFGLSVNLPKIDPLMMKTADWTPDMIEKLSLDRLSVNMQDHGLLGRIQKQQLEKTPAARRARVEANFHADEVRKNLAILGFPAPVTDKIVTGYSLYRDGKPVNISISFARPITVDDVLGAGLVGPKPLFELATLEVR